MSDFFDHNVCKKDCLAELNEQIHLIQKNKNYSIMDKTMIVTKINTATTVTTSEPRWYYLSILQMHCIGTKLEGSWLKLLIQV